MDLNELASYIRSKGCRVRLYNKRSLVSADCTGYFNELADGGPIIHLATKGRSKVKVRAILLHEFAHFIQWKTGMFDRLGDTSNSWCILEELLDGKDLDKHDLLMARAAILTIEYSAEIITLMMAKKLNVDVGGERKYLRAVESYVTLIKWAFHAKKFPYGPSYKYFNGKHLSWRELFNPITKKQIRLMTKKVHKKSG